MDVIRWDGARSRAAVVATITFVVVLFLLTPPGSRAEGTKMPTLGFGTSTPTSEWDLRLSEVGPGIEARRIFLWGFTSKLTLVNRALSDGMYPVVSFKTGSFTWSQVVAGAADTQLRSLATALDALPGQVFVAVHHEPAGDGIPSEWAAMQERVLPILGAPDNVTVGVIVNGWWWSVPPRGYSDERIAAYLTSGVLAASEVVALDAYDTRFDLASVKTQNFLSWADRVAPTHGLGVGEFNGLTAASITSTMTLVMSDPRFHWANVYNSSNTKAGVLTGDRLQAFKDGLAAWLAQ